MVGCARPARQPTIDASQGNLAFQLPRPTRNEIGELIAHIGAMRDSLRNVIGTMHMSEARSRAILRTMRDGVVLIDARASSYHQRHIEDMFGTTSTI